MDRYEIIIYWSSEDQAFIAEVPELPGCMAHGSTHEEALGNIRSATELWIETAKELKLTPMLPVPLESLSDIELLREWHAQRNLEAFALRTPQLAGVTIDVLLFPPVDFAGMTARAVEYDVAGTAIRVVSIDDLIALKQAVGRPIDLSDIEHLQRIKVA